MSARGHIPLLAVLTVVTFFSSGFGERAVAERVSGAAGAITNGPPQLPAVKAPVEFFRELLAMTPGERKRALANRTPESQERIIIKLQEYEQLRPDDRELRLQATELRWYLAPLMGVAPSNRVDLLEIVPSAKRALVEARLQEWDRLPESAQRSLLENQIAINYFAEMGGRGVAEKQEALAKMTPQSRERLEAGLARWNQLAESERQQLLTRFSRFFDLTPAEKQKALATLSEQERRQIERTLRTYGGLSPEQRAKCIRGFNRFASMDVAERQQFLKSAERWQAMTPQERQAWRDLVARLNVPPMPTELSVPPMPPRLPPVPRIPRGTPTLTNVTVPRSAASAPGW